MQQTICTLDGISFRMKEVYDFGFLTPYGHVFKVFDDQDSGNICFGMQRQEERFFIKYAGAPTLRGCVSAQEAAENLKKTVPLYRALKHPCLIELLETFETDDGFGMVFRWTDALCMGRMYPEAHARFMAPDNRQKLDVMSDILCFMEHVHRSGYLAVDFYDGSIMYDFASGRTQICDIDFFRPKPAVNDMGRMWGSSLFQAPEEYRLGAVLDERTNVYTVGATAFALFAGYRRTPEDWTLGKQAYDVAARAVHPDPDSRQQTIRQFMEEWTAAVAIP